MNTDGAGAVQRVVFLALCGEGRVECFWPVPLENEPATSTQGQLATATKTVQRRQAAITPLPAPARPTPANA